MNTIVLGTIPGTRLILKTYCEMKDFEKEIELFRFAFHTFEKTLIELRSFLRGPSFDKERYLDQSKTVDNIIKDWFPLVDTLEQQCEKKSPCDFLFINFYVLIITN